MLGFLHKDVPHAVPTFNCVSAGTQLEEDDGHDSRVARTLIEHMLDGASESFLAASSIGNSLKLGLRQPSKMGRLDDIGRMNRNVAEQHLLDMMSQEPPIAKRLDVLREDIFKMNGSRCERSRCKDTADVATPSRIFPPEIMEHVEEKHIGRTLAVHDIRELGIDALGLLRKYFSKFGKVEWVVEPRLTRAQGLGVVRVEDVETVRKVMALGESHTIGRSELVVQRVDATDRA
eukprot:TRINITY_DN41644_c0_g1_i1.p1 TRINITY_DN41644_c0_g1~~TRINITY_DN41644_c0_g1_i1.p1  ORF type:complete len:233 (-),score=26.03 TRINITY_DN41644_c0_g1_i1:330-1028(-)